MEDNTLKVDGLSIKFCGKNVDPPTPESFCLPVMIHSCPDDFSTLDYFDVIFMNVFKLRTDFDDFNDYFIDTQDIRHRTSFNIFTYPYKLYEYDQ